MLMKLCPSEQNLVATILKSKWPPHVTCKHAQMVHILGKLQFTDQNLLAKIKTMLYLGIQSSDPLETLTSKSPWQKKLNDDVIFQILLTYQQKWFLVCKKYMGHVTKVMVNQHLLSRGISGLSFNFIACVELEISGGKLKMLEGLNMLISTYIITKKSFSPIIWYT